MPPKGYKLTDAQKKHLSDINKGKKASAETRKKMSESHKGMTGRTHTKEAKCKMS